MMLFFGLTAALAEPSVVFVGNSYVQSNNLPRLVEGVATSIDGWTDVTTVSLTAGGLTLADHAERMNDANSTWSEAFSDAHDWFIFQDQSQIPGFPQTEVYWQDSLNGLRVMHEQVTAQTARSMLMLTWGRRDGDPQNSVLYGDFLAMQERLNDGYLAYASLASTVDNPIYVAPVGPVFAHIYDHDRTIFSDLYSGDGSHPSVLGSTVASMALVSSLTGRRLTSEQMDLSTDVADVLQNAVEETVLYDAVGTYPLPWIWTEIPEDGRIEAQGMWPLLRIRADQERDLHVVDGRLWVEQGRLIGTTTVEPDSEFRIVGGSQVGPVNGNVHVLDGRLRLSEVTGDLIQTGGEIWLDISETTVTGTAQLTTLQLQADLESACLSAGTLDVTGLTETDGLTWTLDGDSTICVLRADVDSADPVDTGDQSAEEPATSKEETGCASGLGLILLFPVLYGRRRID
jgi:hypothetical protein